MMPQDGLSREVRAVEINPLRSRAQRRVLRAVDRQNVFRRHIGLEQVGRAKDVTAAGPEYFAVAAGLSGHFVGRAMRQQMLHINPAVKTELPAIRRLQCAGLHVGAEGSPCFQ